jgi:hypothetical protein
LAVLEVDEYDDSAVPLDLGEEEIDEFAMLQQLEQERLLIAKQKNWNSRQKLLKKKQKSRSSSDGTEADPEKS